MLNKKRIKKYQELSDRIDLIVKYIDHAVLDLTEKHDSDFNMELSTKFHELSERFEKEAVELEKHYQETEKEIKALKEDIEITESESFSRKLEDYFDNILQDFVAKNPDFKINGYTFNRDRISDQYYWIKDNSDFYLEIYATPFYDADSCLKIYYENDYIEIDLKITGNKEKDLQYYFVVMKRYLRY